MDREKWFFTFGSGQNYAGHFVKIEGTYAEARSEMFRRYGSDWAFQYSESDWQKMKNDPNRMWEWPTELNTTRIKPCYVCGNTFEGDTYAGPYEMCPKCYRALFKTLEEGRKNGKIS